MLITFISKLKIFSLLLNYFLHFPYSLHSLNFLIVSGLALKNNITLTDKGI